VLRASGFGILLVTGYIFSLVFFYVRLTAEGKCQVARLSKTMSGVMIRKTRIKMSVFVGAILLPVFFYLPHLVPIFFYNPWINAFILATLAFGLVWPFYQLNRLSADQAAFKEWRTGRDPMQWTDSTFLRHFFVDKKGAPKTRLVFEETQALLDRFETQLDDRHSLTQYLCGVLILLGLLGTFWGLTQTVSAITESFKNISDSNFLSGGSVESLKKGFQAPLSGMGVAFSSSIFGLVGSLALGCLDFILRSAEKEFFNHVGECMLQQSQSLQLSEPNNGAAYTLALLEQTAETLNSLQAQLLYSEESRRKMWDSMQLLSQSFSSGMILTQNNQEQVASLLKVDGELRQSLYDLTASLKLLTSHEIHKVDWSQWLARCDLAFGQISENQQRATREIKEEIRLVSKLLSLLSEPEDYQESKGGPLAQ
jgi:biopolymer transport protein ExbB/TolQ